MKLLSIFSVIFPLVICGCATVHRDENATNKVYLDLTIAAANTTPLLSVNYGEFRNFNIEKISPSIQVEKTINKFEIVEIDGKKGEAFSISVGAICDCLGFRKWAVLPMMHMVSPTGELLPIKENVISPTGKNLKGIFPQTGKYKVLVVANNAAEGKYIGEASNYIGKNEISLPITVHPTGLVQLRWQKN